MLPNLIVIGAAKAGTTALYQYLKLHPEVFMSREKELRFFSNHWHRVLAMRERVPHPLYLLFSEKLEPTVVSDRLRARLVEYYADDVARLRAFTGLPLESWSV